MLLITLNTEERLCCQKSHISDCDFNTCNHKRSIPDPF